MGFIINEDISPELEFVYDDGVNIRSRTEPTVTLPLSREDMTKLFILWLRCMDWELDFWEHMQLESRIKCRRLKKSVGFLGESGE